MLETLRSSFQKMAFRRKYGPKEGAYMYQAKPEQREALEEILFGESEKDFRDFPVFQNETATLIVTDKSGDFEKYVDVTIDLLPDNASYAGPSVMPGFTGLWPAYSLVMDEMPKVQNGVRVGNIALKDGSVLPVVERGNAVPNCPFANQISPG